MKWFPAFLAACLCLAAPLAAQSSSGSKDDAPMRPYLAAWAGAYGGVCAFTDESGKLVEVPVRVIIQRGKATEVGIGGAPATGDLTINIYINPDAGKDERMELTPEKIVMTPKYADPVALEAKKITGGFGGGEDLIDGEVKIFQISLNAAPKPIRTYRFRVGSE